MLANDLNTDGVEFLRANIALNKVDKRVKAFNMDARAFVKMLVNR